MGVRLPLPIVVARGTVKAALAVDCRCELAEGPLWHAGERAVYWIDIPRGAVHRFDPARGTHERRRVPAPVGALLVDDRDALVAFGAGLRARRLTRADEREVDGARLPGVRANDAIADARGRVLVGAMRWEASPPASPLRRLARSISSRGVERARALHRREADGRWTRLVAAGLSNGLAFGPDEARLYHADSEARALHRYAYDPETGELGARERFRAFAPGEGTPDGIAADVEGHLWCALWDGGAAVRLDPAGREVARVELPCARVTSVAFGGEDLRSLYITTAAEPPRPDGPARCASAGGLFHVAVEVPGVRRHRAHLPPAPPRAGASAARRGAARV